MGKLSKLAAATAFFLVLTPKAFADSLPINIAPPPQASGLQDPGLIATAPQFIVTLLFVVAIIAAIVFLIYGGIKWITSGGDEKQVEGARNHIVAAIVGLVLVVATFFILNLVFAVLVGGGHGSIWDSLCIPNLTNTTCGKSSSTSTPGSTSGSGIGGTQARPQ